MKSILKMRKKMENCRNFIRKIKKIFIMLMVTTQKVPKVTIFQK